MRKAKMIATKDHFFFYLTTPDKNDEIINITQDNIDPKDANTNVLTFFSSGNNRRFYKDGNGNWQKHLDFVAPLMFARKAFGGGVTPMCFVNNDDSKSSLGQVIAREHYDTGCYADNNNASDGEKETMENNPNQTVVISEQCSVSEKRNLETCEIIIPEAVPNPITEEALNIDWGE